VWVAPPRGSDAGRLGLRPNPHRSSFGRYGTLSVRFGKASRGGAPERRNVLTVFDWAVEILEQYVDEVRPLYGRPEHPALWLTEREGGSPAATSPSALRSTATSLACRASSRRMRLVTAT
jgi:hypothetical protein